MKHRITSILVALYLLACLVAGGSTQIPWTNLGLQLVGIALIAWAAVSGSRDRESRSLIDILLPCALVLVLLQLIPLPADMWTKLPGREVIATGFASLGYPLRAMPISLVPHVSVLTVFAAIPAIAVFVATERLAPSPRAIAAAIVVGMIGSVFVGALQVAGGPKSGAYFYEIHNPGAIGFFANQNHMAALLLLGIPMAAALTVSAESKRKISSVTRYGLGLSVLFLILLGIALNASRAALALSVPVLLASASLFPALVRWRAPALILSALVLVAAVGIVMTNPITAAELSSDATGSGISRGEIWATTAKAAADTFPFGTGLGSFETIYHLYEDPALVTRSYVNHAHNDYLELALELGAGGIALLFAFLTWWGIVAVRTWTSTYSSPFARAATIATAAILAHSVVDFPLRTAAISAAFAACLAMMTRRNLTETVSASGGRRQSRHVTIG